MSDEPRRFCATCRHVDDGVADWTDWSCTRPTVNLVTGETEPLDLPCGDERGWSVKYPDACGREGKHWEAKNETQIETEAHS